MAIPLAVTAQPLAQPFVFQVAAEAVVLYPGNEAESVQSDYYFNDPIDRIANNCSSKGISQRRGVTTSRGAPLWVREVLPHQNSVRRGKTSALRVGVASVNVYCRDIISLN